VNAVEATGMVRRFGAVTALDGLSFAIRAGELYGLVGPDGAGKTTAIRALAGLLALDAGSARIYGADPKDRDVRERLGLMPQQYSLYGDLSVGENLRFFSRLYALPRATFRQRVERLLSITRLGPFLDRPAAALSGGMYKKLALACALLHEPDVLLLDEPTNGVDPVSRRELWALLYEFVTGGMAVLISTPYMDEAERCHRVGLAHHGRLLLEGEPQTLIASFEHEAYEIRGGDRAKVEAALSSLRSVFASSPAGSRLRIVASHGASREIEDAVAPLGAALVRVPPDFEDLYLARLREEAA
jgi:ABC-2 type transport system ATP-binding protein